MYLVADIGGTKTRIAGSIDFSTFTNPIVFPTPQDYMMGISQIIKTIKMITVGERVQSLVIGLAASLTSDQSIINDAAHLPLWSHHALASDLAAELGVPVLIENDTALVGLGEAVFGAGLEFSRVAYVTVSTGVNGVLVIDGVIDRESASQEIGHRTIVVDGIEQEIEQVISGTAIESKFSMKPYELGIDSPVWEELAHHLSKAIDIYVLPWKPEVIVLGGSMMNEIGISHERVAFHLKQLDSDKELPKILHSRLEDFGGLYGGLARTRQIIQLSQ